MAAERTLTGRVPREAIRRLEISRLTSALIERYRSLEDLTGTVSDSLDKLGLAGAVPASILAPTLPARRVVGQAVTVRNVARVLSVTRAAAEGQGKMGEHEAYNLAEAGDVIVIEGLSGVSNMGGQSATVAGGHFPLSSPLGSGRMAASSREFALGETVRVKNEYVPGHVRVPAYIRGKSGVVIGIRRPAPFPDASAHNLDSPKEPTYDVRFRARDLWPDSCDDALNHVGVFQSYLERFERG